MDLADVFRLRTVAVVGASRDPTKPAHLVPLYLKREGYRVIPINPNASEIWGERAYRSLMEVPEEVDVVEVFRPSEEVPRVAEEVLRRRRERGDVKVLWLQEGIRAPPEVRGRLEEAGVAVFEDMCMMKVHSSLFGKKPLEPGRAGERP